MGVRWVASLAAVLCAVASVWSQESPPTAVYAWNSDLLEQDDPGKVTASQEPLKAVIMAGARGGTFSGKVCVGSASPLAGLKASATALTGEAGTIAASAVQVRYAVAWGEDLPASRRKPVGLDILLDEPPADVPVTATRAGKGAVAAVWVTVAVPDDAKAGLYRGRLTVEVGGAGTTFQAPIELRVADWTIPDSQQWRTWVELIETPDTLALEYDVPLWSEAHWRMIEQSLRLVGGCGSRSLYVPLICHTNFGNSESMVRWIMKDSDRVEYDFTIFDRYVDTAVKEMGRPKLVVLGVWDIFMVPGGGLWTEDWWSKLSEEQKQGSYFRNLKERGDLRRAIQQEHGNGPPVTVVDPQTKETAAVYLPPLADPRSASLWRPLLTEIRERMRRRGLQDVLMLGMLSDARPTKEEASALHDFGGGLPWASHSHSGKFARGGAAPKLHGIAPIAYDANVWDLRYAPDPSVERPHGWSRPELVVQFDRFHFNSFLPSVLRHMAEFDITGHQRGVGRIGADNWPCVKDQRGRRVGTALDRYPQSMWRNLDMLSYLLAPGPKGPVGTARYEIFRGGIQECEARIAIERALLDDASRSRLGGDLAERCRRHLDERLAVALKGVGSGPSDIKGEQWRYKQHPEAHAEYVASGWQKRTGELFDLAGEVAARLKR